MKRILLWDLPDEIMLIVEYASSIVYQNQVGGVVNCQAELEGVLAPLNLGPDSKRELFEQPYPSGIQGISPAIADAIDGVLAREAATRNFKVNRARLAECWEAWIHVLVDAPESMDPLTGADFSPLLGFGRIAGVLTWPNSD